ncbi:hypothetical protein HispidOSU_003996, partial [Sigmodon hispidus]
IGPEFLSVLPVTAELFSPTRKEKGFLTKSDIPAPLSQRYLLYTRFYATKLCQDGLKLVHVCSMQS